MLKEKRKALIEHVKTYSSFLNTNREMLDIYDGNLRPYVDNILRSSLSDNYYSSIKDRVVLVNVLQRYINKVSTVYSKPPQRECENEAVKQFLEYYESEFEINNAGQIANQYASLFKGFAWEPYIDKDGNPSLRTIPYDRFLVYSDSKQSPEDETVFIKIMGQKGDTEDSVLLFAYTDTEFDAFYMNEVEASEYLVDNQGVNPIGTIPFVYGKRQKHKLIPTLDTDTLAIAKSISVIMTDMAGALMYSCFPILYGIDVDFINAKLSPNALWNIKSDANSDKTPSIGVLQPTADSQKVVEFVVNIFILWLETKGIRVGSMGNTSGTAAASGISKIIDEMDTFEVKKKEMEWFKQDEEELWNDKLPKIHNYWIKSGAVDPSKVPAMVPEQELEIEVEFEKPTPMLSRSEEIANIKMELDMGIISKEIAIKLLHPDYTEDLVSEIIESGAGVMGMYVKSQSDMIAEEKKTALPGEKISIEENPIG